MEKELGHILLHVENSRTRLLDSALELLGNGGVFRRELEGRHVTFWTNSFNPSEG